MTYFIFQDEALPVLASGTALIKADERLAFEEAVSLLAEARALKAQTQAELTAMREQAQADGYQAGLEQARTEMAEHLATLSRAFEDMSQVRRAETAQAAMAAFRAIIGTLDASALAPGLAETALSRMAGEGPAVVEVAPEMEAAVAARLAPTKHVDVRANPEFGPLDCEIQSPNGRVVASLDVQMATLAARWGVEGTAA